MAPTALVELVDETCDPLTEASRVITVVVGLPSASCTATAAAAPPRQADATRAAARTGEFMMRPLGSATPSSSSRRLSGSRDDRVSTIRGCSQETPRFGSYCDRHDTADRSR